LKQATLKRLESVLSIRSHAKSIEFAMLFFMRREIAIPRWETTLRISILKPPGSERDRMRASASSGRLSVAVPMLDVRRVPALQNILQKRLRELGEPLRG